MSDMPRYERDPYLVELDTSVVSVGAEDGRPWVILEDTVFYPEGGGQPADLGAIDGTPVVDVQRHGDGIRHYLGKALRPGAVHLQIDWRRRFDHMQQHTAQHLITAIADDELGWPTTSFHLGANMSDVELDVAHLPTADLARLEERVAETIRAALPVTCRRVRPEDLASLQVRTRGLPAGHRGDVRLVEIAGVDRNTCGGTHVANTAEIEAVKLLGSESMRGGSRLHWVAGGRLRRRLAEHEQRAMELRRLFETADDEIVALAAAKLDRAKAAERRLRWLQEALAEQSALRLSATPGPLVDAHFEQLDGGFLQLLLRHLTAAEERRAIFLTASSEKGCFFALRAAAGEERDPRALGGAIAAALGGKGGGSAESFQGKAASLVDRRRAVDLLLGERPAGARA